MKMPAAQWKFNVDQGNAMSEPESETNAVPPVERMKLEVDRWLEAVRSTGERTLESLGLTGANRTATPPIDVI